MRTHPFPLLVIVLVGCSLFAASVEAQVWEVGNRLLVGPHPQPLARFGEAVAVGDFDGDGRADVAVGSPFWSCCGFSHIGRVTVFLSGPGRTFTMRFDETPGTGTNDLAGFALAAGNFDSTPRDELAVGLPGASDNGEPGSGAVVIVSFPSPWVTSTRTFRQSNVRGESAAAADGWGKALAVGDFNGDGFADLAVGAPLEDLGSAADAGHVTVLFGSSAGISASDTEGLFAEDLLAGASGAGDQFAAALTAGDFDGDGFADLAIGAPLRDVNGHPDAGEVRVAFGSSLGLRTDRSQRVDGATFGLAIHDGDELGLALAAGDFDGPGPVACIAGHLSCADDLAIGSPFADVGTIADAGTVVIARGKKGIGLTNTSPQILTTSALGFLAQSGDLFGAALAAGAIDESAPVLPAHGATDLVIGAPFANDANAADIGVAYLLLGSPATGLSTATRQFNWEMPGTASYPPAAGDNFARSLAVGDLDGDGAGDLVVGIPFRDAPSLGDAGAVQILYGALFADGFESGFSANWSYRSP